MDYREKLPDRRANVSLAFEHIAPSGAAHEYTATVGYFDDGRVGEIFCGARKITSEADIAIKDAAIAVSLALQAGVPIEVFRKTFMRRADGTPEGPLGTLLDIVAGLEPPVIPQRGIVSAEDVMGAVANGCPPFQPVGMEEPRDGEEIHR